ncbi:uncharacterized protein KY384_002081 [Bacidia gigantensis]|uniref:uncharacterized protein n=1 Tax=Bacidia gigantensis TaxID=2732470 RepID=UPI001D05A69B|nr:uncharacterized protein KY384_002081 [Bacidia gigantensis]KAG8533298.1 hypothetical protein KY384_002081 [Bacidia gigantensis]
MVQRLAKGVLPPNTSLHKDAVLAMQKSATVFISHLAAQANNTTQTNNRRTIPPQAISEALHDLEFDSFIPRVEAELRRFGEIQTGKRNEYRRKLKEGVTKTEGGEGNTTVEMSEVGDGEDGDRAAKRSRIDEEGEAETNGTAYARGPESPSAQLRMQMQPREGAREWDPDQDPEEDDEEDVDEEEEDGGVEAGQGEEGEEDDDADEYPDAGHRAESLGMDDPDEEDQREQRRRFAYGPGGEGGGESSGDEEEGIEED